MTVMINNLTKKAYIYKVIVKAFTCTFIFTLGSTKHHHLFDGFISSYDLTFNQSSVCEKYIRIQEPYIIESIN